jgi:hypothetical protein
VTLPLAPPRADGDLPDDWQRPVETAVEYVVECADADEARTTQDE